MMMLFEILPVELVRFILQFLQRTDRIQYISSNKQLLERFCEERIFNICEDDYLQQTFKSLIAPDLPNPQKQLIFRFNSFDSLKQIIFDFPDVFQLELGSHCLLQYLKSKKEICTFHTLAVLDRHSDVDDFNNALIILDDSNKFKRLKHLILFLDLPRPISIIPKIKNLEALTIRGFIFKDSFQFPSLYSNLHQVTLIRCAGLTDVSMLNNIYHLIITSCDDLVDISSLQDNSIIEIDYCNNILDFSKSFSNSKQIIVNSIVSEVKIGELQQYSKAEKITFKLPITNLSPVIPKLSPITRYLSIQGIPIQENCFDQLISLTLKDSSCTTSAKGLGKIRSLKLSHLRNLKCIQDLGEGNQSVEIRSCPKIIDFSSLRFVPSVLISDCTGFRKATDVDHVKKLELGKEESYLSLSLSQNIQHLIIPTSHYMEDISPLRNIPIIEVPFFFIFLIPTNCSHEKIVLHYVWQSPSFLPPPLLKNIPKFLYSFYHMNGNDQDIVTLIRK